MTRFVSTSIALFCFLGLFALFAFFGCTGSPGNGNANANSALSTPSTATVNCAAVSTTNDQIVNAIYAAIANSPYSKEIDQFNITANRPDVKIIGWSTHTTEIIALAKSVATGCIIPDSKSNFANSNANLAANYQQRLGCPPEHGPCGDICIPIGEPCRVTSGPASQPSWSCVPAGTPSPSPTSSPGGSTAATVNKAP